MHILGFLLLLSSYYSSRLHSFILFNDVDFHVCPEYGSQKHYCMKIQRILCIQVQFVFFNIFFFLIDMLTMENSKLYAYALKYGYMSHIKFVSAVVYTYSMYAYCICASDRLSALFRIKGKGGKMKTDNETACNPWPQTSWRIAGKRYHNFDSIKKT